MHVESECGVLPTQDRRIVGSELSVFSQDWWLNTARRSTHYRELKVVHGSYVAGRFAFDLSKNRVGLACGQDPYWSHLGGPILDQRLSGSAQSEVIRLLLSQLPRWASFYFVCDANLSYADVVRSAFTDAGFQHSTQVTYVRYPEEGDVLNSRKSKHRGHFRRAAKSLSCVDISAKEFVQFFERNLKVRGKRSYAPLDTLPHLIEEAMTRGCARAIAAKPNAWNGLTVDGDRLPFDAAIVYLWDSSRCYYWLSTHRVAFGEDPAVRPHPDAVKLLAFHAMEHAQAMNLIFDADGVVTLGADNLYRNIFGLRTQQRRDVFQRVSAFERLYQKSRRAFVRRNNPIQE
jgi:hypothetical protein